MGAQLMAIAAEGKRQRYYIAPKEEHEKAADVSRPETSRKQTYPNKPLAFVSRATVCALGTDLFTNRQLKCSCDCFSDLVQEVQQRVSGDSGDVNYANAIATYLAFAVDKAADRNSTICCWEPGMDRLRGTFQRQALPMTWDFAEANPFGDAGGDFKMCVASLCEVVQGFQPRIEAIAELANATEVTVSLDRLVSTDPPYYDNV